MIECNSHLFFNSTPNSYTKICYGTADHFHLHEKNYCNLVKLTSMNASETAFENFYHLAGMNRNLLILFKNGLFKANLETLILEKIEISTDKIQDYNQLLLKFNDEDVNWISDESTLQLIESVTGLPYLNKVKVKLEDQIIDLIKEKSGLMRDTGLSTLTNKKNNTVEFRFYYDYKNAGDIILAMQDFLNTAAGYDLKFNHATKKLSAGPIEDITLTMKRDELPKLLAGLKQIEKREFNVALINAGKKNPMWCF